MPPRASGRIQRWALALSAYDYCFKYKSVDAFTKWVEVHVMTSSTAEATVEKLRTTFAAFGIPETVVSDNGTCFVGEVFQTFMSRNGIKHIKVAGMASNT